MNLFFKKYSPVILLCLFLLATSQVYSQQKLKGIYIVDAATKVPVRDAFVQSFDLGFSVSSDENGFVSLKNSMPSVSTLTIKAGPKNEACLCINDSRKNNKFLLHPGTKIYINIG